MSKQTRKAERFHQVARIVRTPYTVSRNIHHTLHSIMQGGMNSTKYNMLANLGNQGSNVSNLNIHSVNNITSYPNIEPPWSPANYNTIEYTLNSKPYSFLLREEYQCTDNIWYMYVRIGSEKNSNCVVAVLSSDTDFQNATILEIKYAATCSSCSTLPGNGIGARILMYTMLRYLREKGIYEYKLSDNAMQNCPGSKDKYALSDLYFLANGETYYHKFGFFPSEYMEEYIQLVLFMKTVQWNTMRSLSNEKDYVNAIHELEKTVEIKTNKEYAKNVFKRIWTNDCLLLKKYSHIVFIYIAKYLDVPNLYLNIPQIWNGYEQLHTTEVREMYTSFLNEQQQGIFYETVVHI